MREWIEIISLHANHNDGTCHHSEKYFEYSGFPISSAAKDTCTAAVDPGEYHEQQQCSKNDARPHSCTLNMKRI